MELNGFTALRDQYLGTPVSTHYQYLPHLFSYSAHSALVAPQPRSLDPQSHGLISQLVCAEDLEPLGTPMLIEDGCVGVPGARHGHRVRSKPDPVLSCWGRGAQAWCAVTGCMVWPGWVLGWGGHQGL